MFATELSLSVVVAQTLVIYLFLVIALSRFGRRQAAQVTSIELIILAVLGSSVETAMVNGSTSLLAGLISASTLLVGNSVLAQLTRRSKRLRRFLLGGPVLLIHHGRILPHRLARVGLTEADVQAALRQRGYDSLDQIRFAVLEIDGSVGVVPRTKTIHRARRG